VSASSRPGGWCLDFFAGSGTLGAACRALGRRFVLVDCNPAAVAIAAGRLRRGPEVAAAAPEAAARG
jgi:site-specific DNA-methyltransferase (adenine-specific)